MAGTSAEPHDVIVVGGGNAGLCAAMSARDLGARVLVLESAPREFRGGNSRHTRNLRYLHDQPTGHFTGPYPEEEFWDDLLRVTEGHTQKDLALLTIRASRDLGEWMHAHGARFQAPLRGSLQLSRTNAFFRGGGKALMNAYYRTAERSGVEVRYSAEVRDVVVGEGVQAVVELAGGERIVGKSLVAASGGFQANRAWLADAWGQAAANFIVRGTPYDTGRVLKALLDRGARPVGDPTQCHAIAVDARAPAYDGGIVTRLDTIPFGVVVNRDGERFYDEGEDLWPKRYAIWGRLIAAQPDQIAYSIIDDRARGRTMPSLYDPIVADSIGDLAGRLDLDPARLEQTVARYNGAVRTGTYDPSVLDDCHTVGLIPPKSHWAMPLDRPPFMAYPLRPGITFTYMGVSVNSEAQVLDTAGAPIPGIYAAGEIMSGNVLGKGYLAGFGMTLGTVFGRIAGASAARQAMA